MTTPVEQQPAVIEPQPPAVEAPPAPQEQPPAEPPADPQEMTPEQYKAELKKVRAEAAGWRTKLREVEPIVKAHTEAEERNKTELQRATERAQTLEQQLAAAQQQTQLLGYAAKYGIPEEDYDLLGSGTPEEMESRAVRIAHMREAAIGQQPAIPPSNRPVESLRPGASPQPPKPADNSYPEAWRPRTRGTS